MKPFATSWLAEVSRALMFVALALGSCRPAHAQSRRMLAELGRLDPPPYETPLVRSGDASDVFDEAIHAYAARQFDHAAELLRRRVAAEPDDAAANFYLAVSLMMTDEVGEAEDRLRAVLALDASPFTVPAHFVLAKALVRLGRLDPAERELLVVVKKDGPWARSAVELLPRVRAMKKRE
jgi:predicted Zn-dependent protease